MGQALSKGLGHTCEQDTQFLLDDEQRHAASATKTRSPLDGDGHDRGRRGVQGGGACCIAGLNRLLRKDTGELRLGGVRGAKGLSGE